MSLSVGKNLGQGKFVHYPLRIIEKASRKWNNRQEWDNSGSRNRGEYEVQVEVRLIRHHIKRSYEHKREGYTEFGGEV